ncbi:MAG: DUF4012 domain-containing protein [Chloroflexi bacterium]|nr:DUF4012 domain-containing protein [Chloroflexota bacterium]
MHPKQISKVLLAIGVLLIVVWGARVALMAQSLSSHLGQAQSMADTKKVDPKAACELVQQLRDDIVGLNQEAGALVTLAPMFAWLPSVGGDLQSAPQLLATADGLTEAGAIVCSSLAPMLDAFGKSSADFSIEKTVALLSTNQADLQRGAQAANRAQSAWAQVDVQRLSPSIANKVKLIDRGLPLIQTGLTALATAPDLLGANDASTFLLIAQNEDELRPTGGYITGVGEIQFKNGQLASMVFRDSYAVDDFSQPYPYPPEPLQRYMQIDQWVFRDSNWSPDFPTVVRQALPLYRPGYQVDPVAVIALDQFAMQEVVRALGPISIKGNDAPVTGDNIIAYVRGAWAPAGGKFSGDWWKNRKSFMGPLAEAVWERVKSGKFNPTTLGQTMLRLLDQKHILIYARDAKLAQELLAQGWDGSLRPSSSDALMVVDANIGYNKSNARVRQSIDYQVDLRSSTPQALLTLTYTNTSQVNYPCKPEIRYDPIYETMMDRCYFDDLRVYVPAGSQLNDATRIPVPAQALVSGTSEPGDVIVRRSDEGAWTVFEVMGVLPTGAVQTRSFNYALPANVVKWDQPNGTYSLRIQKQPGTAGYPVSVRVHLPDQMALIGSSSKQFTLDGEWFVYQMILDRDQDIGLHFRRQSK